MARRIVIVGNFIKVDDGLYQILIQNYSGHGVYTMVISQGEGFEPKQVHYLGIFDQGSIRNVPCPDKGHAEDLALELSALIEKFNGIHATQSVTEIALGKAYYQETNGGGDG